MRSLSKNGRAFIAALFAFVVFGLILLPLIFWTEWRVQQMLTWPNVDAIVRVTGIHSYRAKYDTTRYFQDITYEYSVKGGTYRNDRVSFGGTGPNWDYPNGARDSLPPVGSTIRVHYNSSDPADSVINVVQTPVLGGPVLKWIVLGLVAALGLTTILAGFQWKNEWRQYE